MRPCCSPVTTVFDVPNCFVFIRLILRTMNISKISKCVLHWLFVINQKCKNIFWLFFLLRALLVDFLIFFRAFKSGSIKIIIILLWLLVFVGRPRSVQRTIALRSAPWLSTITVQRARWGKKTKKIILKKNTNIFNEVYA